MSLHGSQFPAFFEAIWGYRPFAWQERLALQVCETDAWPDLLDLPTGSGKTSTMDIAVFWQAVDAIRPPAERKAPRRILLVVDRRVVVDQAYHRARHLAAALAFPTDRVLREVAERLRSLWDGPAGAEPLGTSVLRGGTIRDEAWARRPDIPLVASSTVDQVGSRLLFRGYGVSSKMRPVHAGLLGNDVLLLLDEVHLSQPFEQTLHAIQHHRRRRDSLVGLPDRFIVVPMSATPATSQGSAFGLEASDLDDVLLSRRLHASKPATLPAPIKISSRAPADEGHARLAEAARAHVREMQQEGLNRIAIILNRVAAARTCFHLLKKTWGDQVILLTGRMRPLDKDDVVRRVEQGLKGERPVLVVATQCIEAGADFDFDGLVTECASIDALRQRFGRLNRQGREISSRGVILMRADLAKSSDQDPVYGSALAATWQWLQSQEDLNFGILALDERIGAARREGKLDAMLAPKADAPLLLPGTLSLWAQTHPTPFPDPDPAFWLHGPERSAPEASLVWRADLSEELVQAAADGSQEALAGIVARLSACPPGSLETLSVPIHALRAWLAGSAESDLYDAPARPPDASFRTSRPAGAGKGRPAIRWSGSDSAVGFGTDLRVGDVVVVPSSYGGLAAQVWDPSSRELVADHGDRVQLLQRGRPALRLSPETLSGYGPNLPTPPSLAHDEDPEATHDEVLDRWLAAVQAHATEPWLSMTALRLQGRLSRSVLEVSDPLGKTLMLLGRSTLTATDLRAGLQNTHSEAEATDDISGTEDDDASFIDRAVTLRRHSSDVERWARDLAQRSGLPPSLVNAIALAGWLHDVGKADPRFQSMLRGGNAIAVAMDDEPLAKSDVPAGDRRARDAARRRSRYPRGMRHELMSLELIRHSTHLREKAGEHWDLVQHLVASHHGWCRPFAPPVIDAEPVQIELKHGAVHFAATSDHPLARLDSGITERFDRLNQEYGIWGLAWLEAILRLADHRASEEAQRSKGQ